jgi:hypothetical protein
VEPEKHKRVDIWIPWVYNDNDFNNRVIELQIEGVATYYIYQAESYIKYNTSGIYNPKDSQIPGLFGLYGDRLLLIDINGLISMEDGTEA